MLDLPPPMPHTQLLKINLIAWTFTLPFVIVQETGWFCPYAPRLIECCPTCSHGAPLPARADGLLRSPPPPLPRRFAMCFIASAFFGLDQVGVVLESPFGTRSMLKVPARLVPQFSAANSPGSWVCCALGTIR
jgi:hypothetical protein